jgi:hypothetical protein
MLVGNKVDKVYSLRKFTITLFLHFSVYYSIFSRFSFEYFIFIFMDGACFSDFNVGVTCEEVSVWFLLLNVSQRDYGAFFGIAYLSMVCFVLCRVISFTFSRFLWLWWLTYLHFPIFSQVILVGLSASFDFLWIRNIRRRVIFVWFYSTWYISKHK